MANDEEAGYEQEVEDVGWVDGEIDHCADIRYLDHLRPDKPISYQN